MFEIFEFDDTPINEYHYTQKLGREEASIILNDHWNTYITEDDFRQLQDWGFNTVRIGLVYWACLARPQDPYVQGQTPYLERALNWARTYNIRVWIDLHGVPGSQNGYDNSGLMYHLDWQNDKYPENIADTFTVLNTLGRLYGGQEWQDVVSGIELVNEPNNAAYRGPTLDMQKLKDYYYKGYDTVRNYGANGVIIHDAFQQMGFFNDWLQIPDYWNVVLDQYIGSCNGINNITTWSDKRRTNTRRFIEAQMDAYDEAYGWIFWTYKTERTIEWDLCRLIEYGMFPMPLQNRQHPNQCRF